MFRIYRERDGEVLVNVTDRDYVDNQDSELDKARKIMDKEEVSIQFFPIWQGGQLLRDIGVRFNTVGEKSIDTIHTSEDLLIRLMSTSVEPRLEEAGDYVSISRRHDYGKYKIVHD